MVGRVRRASEGTTEHRGRDDVRSLTLFGRATARPVLGAIAVAVVTALPVALLIPSAAADELTARRAEIRQQMSQTKADLHESSRALSNASIAVEQAQGQLEAARARLAATERQLAAAKARDRALAARLRAAQAELARAIAAVVAGQAKLDAEKAAAGAVVRDQYQQQSNLLPLAALVSPGSTQDLQTRLQWSTTMFDTAQATIDRLTELQRRLTAARARQAALEARVAADRKAAAANLQRWKALQAQAVTQTREVAALVAARRASEAAAAGEVAKDKRHYAALAQERTSVEARIAARIAKARAEAAARRLAAKRAAERAAARAAARRALEAARRAEHRAAKKSHSPQRSFHKVRHETPSRSYTPTRRSGSGRSASHGFSYPVSASITSPYGRRFHPVLHYWKLHDGTDFGAGCGTAIRAPYAGRVAERYYNGGYGNRLMIDHGYVDGRYVTTGYNHAIRYVVSVGEHVSKGQVIGYVGSTGFSTGCHLHLMVWLDGRVVNPMSWF